ncbi:hypothetical protein ACHAXT_012852 [Thalassiosira profunda]
MASEEERAKILAEYHAAAAAGGGEDEWEDDEEADFDPARYDSDEGSDEEEEESPSDYAVLTGNLHLNDEGRVIYNGTWCLRSELDKEEAAAASLGGLKKKTRRPKFKLKSQETLRPPPANGDSKPGRDVFDVRRPTLAKPPSAEIQPEDLPARRTMVFDGFFFEPPPPGSEGMPPLPVGEGGRKHHHAHPVGKKIKERDVELFFVAGGADDGDGNGASEGQGEGKGEGAYRVMGRGHNDYGPFVLEGTYTPPPPEVGLKSPPEAAKVSGDEKDGATTPTKPKGKGPMAKVVCNKTYGSAPSKATRSGGAKRTKRQVEDDDSFDDDFDEKADFAEVNELCEDAGLSVEELRRKYYGGGGGGGEEEKEAGDGGGKISAAKRARLEESDDDDCGF